MRSPRSEIWRTSPLCQLSGHSTLDARPLRPQNSVFPGGRTTGGSTDMIFDHIEKLKKQYTDKYVVVDDARPELQRFRGLTGAVKTVNMSGKALGEFDGYNNIGWYDIDPAFLRVVSAPAPKPAESHKDKAAAPKAESPKAPAA